MSSYSHQNMVPLHLLQSRRYPTQSEDPEGLELSLSIGGGVTGGKQARNNIAPSAPSFAPIATSEVWEVSRFGLPTRRIVSPEEKMRRQAEAKSRRTQARRCRGEKLRRTVTGNGGSSGQGSSNDGGGRSTRPQLNMASQVDMASLLAGPADMLSVFANGDGPNPRTIEGVVFSNWRDGAIQIMCACHCSILSAAEFVLHAGRGQVDYPMKFISITYPSAPSLE